MNTPRLVPATTALRTDHYEVTMLAAARASGTAARPVVFELYARELPPGRRYGVVAGTGRLAAALDAFRFTTDDIEYLAAAAIVDAPTLEWLASYRFRGTVHAYPEGELFFPDSPIVRVAGTFGETVLLETIVLSILNHDCAIAAAASRIVHAAAGRPCVDMGGRRTHEDAAVDAARAAYIAGFAATSNLEAGRRFGMPTMGTAAHAFTLVHDDELTAFRVQLAALGTDTTLLVDTYDTEAGIRNAVAAANEIGCDGPGAVRIDSGDFVETTRHARALLDALGARETKIVVSGDLDEFAIARLENSHDVDGRGRAPIDSYGVGTRLVTGSGHPTAGFVYKLVEVDGRPVAKHSIGKATVGGDKRAFRRFGSDGRARAEVLVVGDDDIGGDARPLEVPVYVDGDAVEPPSLDAARAHHVRACAEFPAATFAVEAGAPALRATLSRATAKEEVRD